MKFLNYLKKAQKEKWAIGQFNVSNLEGIKAVFQAAKNLQSPVIIGTSEGESKYLGLRQAVVLVEAFRKETGVPAGLNLDHSKSFEYIKEAIAAGYDMVHFDGSRLPLAENIEIAKKVVEYAHKKNILVEGEVGNIKGASELLQSNPEITDEDLTKPQDAERFLLATKVDSLAISVGTFHGVSPSRENPHINLSRLQEIKKISQDKAFLVLHGGSGTPENDIREAIKEGIVKINNNTELRIAFREALVNVLKEKPQEFSPYKYLPDAVSAVQKIVEKKILLFNSANKI